MLSLNDTVPFDYPEASYYCLSLCIELLNSTLSPTSVEFPKAGSFHEAVQALLFDQL